MVRAVSEYCGTLGGYCRGTLGGLLLRDDGRLVLHRGAHVRRVLVIHADERQVLLLRRPSVLARFSRLAKHDVLGHLVAVFAGYSERLEIRACLSFVARTEHAHVIGILSRP